MSRAFGSICIYLYMHYAYSLSCKNENNLNVDAWVILKQPSEIHYIYYDATSGFAESSHSINDTATGAMAYTLTQLWSSDMQYLMYNDENPINTAYSDDSEGYNFTVGHTKAVWAFDSYSGFLLQHSVPGFPLGPSQTSQYGGLPSSAWTYGQSFYCFTSNMTMLSVLATNALLMIPNIYDMLITKSSSPSIQELVKGDVNENPLCNVATIQTVGGTTIYSFMKSKEWNNDLWAGCVAPYFRADLKVESWIRGDAIGPSCSTYSVLDIQSVDYPGIGTFSEYDDHSKWAIGSTEPIVCFGDINRMLSQYTRGGGTFCVYDTSLWSDLSKSVVSTNTCSA